METNVIELRKRHFRLKLYEYCFKIIYANHSSNHKSKSLMRSRSLGDIHPKRQKQRNFSSFSLEKGMDILLLYEINRRLIKKKLMVKKEEMSDDKWIEETTQENIQDEESVDDLWIEKSKEKIESPRLKYLKKSSPSVKIQKRVKEEISEAIPKQYEIGEDLLKLKEKTEAPRFKYLKRSSPSVKIKKSVKPFVENSPKSSKKKINDYSKRFSSIPVISQRQSTLPKRRNVVDREIEADRQALKEFSADHKKHKQHKIEVKTLKVVNSDQKTPVDTARSWLSEKGIDEKDAELDQVIDENAVNFERSWSTWSLKKAELLEWDPDFDFQPIGPQEKSIRQKYYKTSLIKESNEIEKKRRCALENKMIFAQVRSEQLMKSSTRPIAQKQPTNNNFKLPVKKLTKIEVPIEILEENESKKEDGKISIFAQIKKALHNVPEKIKEMLSFGGNKDELNGENEDNNEKAKVERSHSITIAELDQKTKNLDKKVRQRPSSAGDGKKCSKDHSKNHDKSNTSIDLHKHNKQVETTLGNILLLKSKEPNPEVIDEKSHVSQKIPSKIAKTGNSKRHPISWHSTQNVDKLNEVKKDFRQKRQNNLKLPKITTSDEKSEKENQQKPNADKSKLPPIPKQPEVFDPIGNPYRSAGRKYSPIPAAGWPPSRSFNPEIGRCKIIDYIEQNWEYKKPLVNYRVEHYHAANIENNKQRFKYRVFWNSNKSQQEGVVFFNVDVSRIQTSEPIELSYRFLGQQKTHGAKFSPTAIPYRKRWLRSLAEGYTLPN